MVILKLMDHIWHIKLFYIIFLHGYNVTLDMDPLRNSKSEILFLDLSKSTNMTT